MIQRDEHVCWISSPSTVTQNEQTIIVVDHMSNWTTVKHVVSHSGSYTDIHWHVILNYEHLWNILFIGRHTPQMAYSVTVSCSAQW